MGKKNTVEVVTVGKKQRRLVRALLFFMQLLVLLIGCIYRDGISFGERIKSFFTFPYFSGNYSE